MAPKQKKGTPAPTSKVPVRRRDGQPTRSEKKATNKAANIASTELVTTIRKEHKDAAKDANGVLEEFTVWNDDVDKAIYKLIACGTSMRDIDKMKDMPSLCQMLTWLSEPTHPFSSTYARAKQAMVSLYEEDIQAIGLSANRGEIITEKQVVTKDGDIVDVVETRYVDNVERSKLAVATLQWTLGHLKPKKHGRVPDNAGDKPNEQLEGLFAALKAGPKE